MFAGCDVLCCHGVEGRVSTAGLDALGQALDTNGQG